MKLRLLSLVLGEVPIKKVDSEVESLWEELKFGMDVDEPVNKNGSHAFIDFCLFLHISVMRLIQSFGIFHILMNVLAVLRDCLDVLKVKFITLWESTVQLFLNP